MKPGPNLKKPSSTVVVWLHGLGGDFQFLATTNSHPLNKRASSAHSFFLQAQDGDIGPRDLGGSNKLKLCRASWHGWCVKKLPA